MDNDYTPPNEMREMLQNIILTCQEWIKVIIDVEGTEQERKVMKEFDAVDIQSILFETA